MSIGIDIGGTKTSLGIFDCEGNLCTSKTIPTEVQRGADRIIAHIVEEIRLLEKHYAGKVVSSIGVAVAGQVERATGLVKFAPNLYWRNVALGQILQELFRRPVVVMNDVRAATWAEWTIGAGTGKKDIVCVFVGTGIGGGMISNGVLVEGAHNCTGEFGHMVIDYQGDLCTCGNIGCWETVAGGWGIVERFKKALAQESEKENRFHSRPDIITAKQIFEASEQGDLLAHECVEDLREALIAGCCSLVNSLNPECLILDGGIIAGAPWLIEAIEFGVRERALKSATEKLEIVRAQLAEKAVYIGAAALARHLGKV
ncbi:MAG: ROK family protein [Parachlamydiaceae bacterium]